MKLTVPKRPIVGALVFVIIALYAGQVVAQELKKVRFGYPSLGFRQGHIWVAKDEGLFKKYGLDVEPIFLRGGQLAIQALAGGDPPLMSIGQVVQAGLAGFDLALIRRLRQRVVFAVRDDLGRNRPAERRDFGWCSALELGIAEIVRHRCASLFDEPRRLALSLLVTERGPGGAREWDTRDD